MIKTIFASVVAAYSLTSGQGVEVPAPGQGAGAGSPPGWVPVPVADRRRRTIQRLGM
eukprot:UN09091